MSSTPDYPALVEYWVLSLRAQRKAASTIKSYTDGVNGLFAWCAENGRDPEPSKLNVNGYVASLLEAGREPTTARARLLGVRRFTAWLVDEGEIDADPLLGIKPPRLDEKIVQPLSDEDIDALMKACKGKDFKDIRDEAMLRLMIETGLRAGECVSLLTDDVDLNRGVAIVRGTKTRKDRSVPFGPTTAEAIGRYKRKRAQHALADRPQLWLGDRKRGFTYDALHKALQGRADKAGLTGFHPHKLRHTAAHRWLAAGGSEGGLMSVAGWTRPDMIQRYAKANAADRAAEEARNLGLGEY